MASSLLWPRTGARETAMSSQNDNPAASSARPLDRVIVFDTTLRDGEQSPGFSMNLGQKLRVARALQELNVDVIEAGFAAASPGDLEAIQGVSRQIEGPIICSLSRCTRGDIEASWKALQDAPRRTDAARESAASPGRARSGRAARGRAAR